MPSPCAEDLMAAADKGELAECFEQMWLSPSEIKTLRAQLEISQKKILIGNAARQVLDYLNTQSQTA